MQRTPTDRRALIACLTLFILGALSPSPLAATPSSPDPWAIRQSSLCAAAIVQAEQRHHLPRGLLGAIAKVESGRPVTGLRDIRAWPWTIDADGKGLFLDSKAAAIAWVQQARSRKVRFIDVGCMQVDLQIHPGAFATLDEAFDPAKNTDYAARYLLSLYAEAGHDWDVAVGLYHSHTPDLAAEYRNRVAAVGAGIVTGIGGPEPLYQRALRQGTLHLSLAGGGRLVLHVRQPGRNRHPPSACAVARMLNPLLEKPIRTRHCRR